ncbi:MAG: folate family ECF transporter S component [Lachnospiraceae bacterium]|nr:folate family ECF transporter S component [Lachnospiraceae bacterium]
MSKIKKIVLSAMFLAMLIVISRFLSINLQLLTIGFAFVPIMLSALYLGPKYSAMIAALGDLMGALLFPFGPYFPGFTISAGITGLIYGLFLYRKPEKKMSNKKLILFLTISSAVVLGFSSVLLNSLFLHVLYGKAFVALLATRVVKDLVMLPIQVIVIFILHKLLHPVIKKYLCE